MTASRRLEAIEATLTPTQRVVAWLEEAHPYGDLETYVHSLVDQPSSAFPINRLTREAATAAKTATRGKPAEEVRRAVARELRETLFRYELVVRLNVTAHEVADRQVLVHAALTGHGGVLLLRQQYEPVPLPTYLEQLGAHRDTAARQVDELLAHEVARSHVEARYLDGYPALFPSIGRAWADRLREMQTLAVIADRLAELDGAGSAELHDPKWVAARAATLERDVVELAKTVTLEKLDDGSRAFAVATGWLRSRPNSSE